MNQICRMGCLISVIITLFFVLGCQGKKGPVSAQSLNRVHFDFDSATIRPEMISVLEENAGYLNKHPSLSVVIEGHCDERGTNEYNLALGDERAGAVENFLSSQGVSNERLRTVSYGEERPINAGHSESAWYENRRADFLRQ